MNKIDRLFHSRYFISAIIILLQLIQLFIVFWLFLEYSVIFTVFAYIFYVGVFMYIINKYESPEFKLPWVIIVMLFFVFGAFAFILLTSNDGNKKIIKKYNKNKDNIQKYLVKDNSLEELKKENKDAFLQANYITTSTNLPAYKNTITKFYNIGEDFHKDLLDDLSKASKFIFMEYFIIEEGKMWNPIYEILKEKANNGVKVYVIYDDFGCMTTLDEKYYLKLQNDNINCIPSNKFTPMLSKIHNNRDHRKITVIDGVVGYVGGINIADEYINEFEKHGHWKDSAVRVEGECVKSLSTLFLETWNTQNKKSVSVEEFFNIEYKNIKSEGIIIPYADGPECFYKESIGKNIYLNMLNNAKDYVYITTPYLICDYELLNAICMCAKKGVDVRIIVPHIPDKKIVFWMTQSNYKMLIESGIKIYEYTPGFIHAKEFICDDMYATCGTINLDYRSLVHHFECGIWMYKTDIIMDMKKDFLETLDKSKEVDKKHYLKGIKKLVAEFLKVYAPLM